MKQDQEVQTKQKLALGFIGWLVICFATSAVGAIASVNAKLFYSQLAKPIWAPPPWLFGPVWSMLFALMATSAWLVWRSGGFRRHRLALSMFLAQLIANALWSWLFFTWQLGMLAFAEVVFLWILIAATTVLFWAVRPIAGVLLIPYLLWVSFAAVLNYYLWQLNPQALA